MIDKMYVKQFLDFIKSKPTAVISTISPENYPESATIFFTVDENLVFYFMTKSFTRKYSNIISNNKVALVIGTENEPVTAQIHGAAEQILDKEEANKRLEQLKTVFTKNDYVGPLFALTGEQNQILLFKITPSWIRWLDMREHNIDRNEFIQILPEKVM